MTVSKLTRLILLRILCVLVALFCTAFTTIAEGQSLTSTTVSWAANLPSNFTEYKLYPNDGACTAGDLYGSGTADLICINKDPNAALVPSSVLDLESTKGGSSGFDTTTLNGTITSSSLAVDLSECAIADFDGDGRSDLACFQTTYGGTFGPSEGSSENWPTAWFSNSTPFSLKVANQNLPMPVQTEGTQGVFFNIAGHRPFSTYCLVGHFMAGPGQQILCNQQALDYVNSNGTVTVGPTNNYYLWRYVATYSVSGTESVTETQLNWTGPPYSYGKVYSPGFDSDCLSGDFNGDGLTDIACPDGNGGYNVGLSTGTGFATSDWATRDSYQQDCTTGDFNGDGKTDIICYAGADNPLHVYVSTGSGFQQPYQTWAFPNMPPAQYITEGPPNPPSTPSVFASICAATDLNGDGKTDLLCYANNSSNTYQWIYALSTGSGFTVNTLNSILPPSVPAPVSGAMTNAEPFFEACTVGNFMGNGIPDILCNPSAFGETPLQPYSVGIIARQ